MAQAKTLTTNELEQVLRYINTTKYAERNRAMLLMGFWAGLRVKEIAQLKMGDVLNDDGTIKGEIRLSAAQTKGNDGRTVFLWEQIQLAKSQIDGTPFVVTKFKSVKDKETGLRRQVEIPKRIREWWFKNEAGKVCVSVKYGTKVLELAKGKHSVEVDSAQNLVKALELVKQAVEAGELDAQIESASGALKLGFKK